jgi:predicted DNA-binding WGR domain protein
MEKSEKADQLNRAQGRKNAPGQNKMRQFVNDAGETIEGTMNDFHTTLREQGYRPVEADEDEGAEAPA